jgi:hypothetical protein
MCLTFHDSLLAIILGGSIQLGTEVHSIIQQGVRQNVAAVFSIGIGATDPEALALLSHSPRTVGAKIEETTGPFRTLTPVKGKDGFIASVMFANYWQVALSILYFAANSLLSCYSVSHEWSSFAKNKKFLRVSFPRGMQRSTYFISVPYRIGLPTLAASIILHWLLSQSMFLVNSKVYQYDTGDWVANPVYDPSGHFVTVDTNCRSSLMSMCPQITHSICFSSLTICSAISFGWFLFLVLLYCSFFIHLKSDMPIVSTDSRSIQAGCQAPLEDYDAHMFPVQWEKVRDFGPEDARYALTTLKGTEEDIDEP